MKTLHEFTEFAEVRNNDNMSYSYVKESILITLNNLFYQSSVFQAAFTYSKLAIERLEQGVKYVQS